MVEITLPIILQIVQTVGILVGARALEDGVVDVNLRVGLG